ncbi:hypothetical protein CR513_10146, partial [Mucuna pruriens]
LVYGFNPLTPIDLLPLLDVSFRLNKDRLSKAKFIKKLHERAWSHIEKIVDQYAKQANRDRKENVLGKGDLVWAHLRNERWLGQRNSQPKDSPTKVPKLVRIYKERPNRSTWGKSLGVLCHILHQPRDVLAYPNYVGLTHKNVEDGTS